MKKILVLLLSLCLLLCLCACGQNQDTKDSEPSTPTTESTDPSTNPTDPSVDDGKVTYTVTITDEQGNPLTGMMVQLCKDACIPTNVDANGVATWTVEEDDYKVSFLSLPAGYTYSGEETEFYFADGETTLTIALKAAE